MCLIALCVEPDEEHAFILAGNRDEFHARPTATLAWWQDRPVLGGRDLEAGGTWLAASRDGRFAAVTNSRDAEEPATGLRSRGLLVTDFLESPLPTMDFLEKIALEDYAGFNLIAGDLQSIGYVSNRDGDPRELGPGVYALSNAVLDTPWHKVEYARSRMLELVDAGRVDDAALFSMLADDTRADENAVDASRLPFELAHAITAPFIVQPEYGTRSSSVLRFRRDGGVGFTERSFSADGSMVRETTRRYSALSS